MLDTELEPTGGGPNWHHALLDQLDWHWHHQVRPRLAGLTDEEYFWEPVPGCWSVRPRPFGSGSGRPPGTLFTLDGTYPVPQPAPVTTIAWRVAHLVVGVFGQRAAVHFGGRRVDPAAFDYAGTAAAALDQLDDAYARWTAGVLALGQEGVARACGPAEGPFADHPMAALILHINREAIHHGAEIALLRDLYRRREPHQR